MSDITSRAQLRRERGARPAASAGQPGAAWNAREYRRALDGLRAFAVGAVFIFHTMKHYLPGGHLGVDMFFALSGFLITGLLIDETQRTGRIAFGKFYARRAIRLLPALLIVIAVFAALGLVTWLQVGAGLFYFANWVTATDHDMGPFIHMWSLSVEEQYYWVWPVLLLVGGRLVARLGRSREGRPALRRSKPMRVTVVACSLVLLVLSAVLHVLWGAQSSMTQFATLTRMDAMLVGSMMAALMPWMMKRWARILPWVGAVMCVVAAGLMFVDSLTVTYQLVTPWIFGLCCAGVAATPAHWLTVRLLSLKPVVWVGKLSYGIYLWHMPLYMTLPLGASPTVRTAEIAVLTLLAAALSYYLVERPVSRRLRPLVKH